MITPSECEISQYWRTQFSSHGMFNLNRAVMPPPLPLQPTYQARPKQDAKKLKTLTTKHFSFDVNKLKLECSARLQH